MNAPLLAVDGGGTRCRLALVTGAAVQRIEVGPANVSSDFDGAIAQIKDGLRRLGVGADVPAYLGLAGVTGPDMAARVAAALPLSNVRVEEDRRAAVRGALGQGDGAVIHAGTGSFVALQTVGQFATQGGWGPVLGDPGSAHWLGMQALRLAMTGRAGPLASRITAEIGAPADIIAFASHAAPDAIAALAGYVTEANDVEATNLMRGGADALADALADLGWTPGMSLCLTGGLAPIYAKHLPAEMRAVLADPRGAPLDGAIDLVRDFARARVPAQAAQSVIYRGGPIFDGTKLHHGMALHIGATGARVIADTGAGIDLGGDVLSPGFVDLQVNGGGGVMLGDDPARALPIIAEAHRKLGTTTILPTLISDNPANVRAAIKAASCDGIAGLHLEGPHLDPRRKGAHDVALIRPMDDADLALYLDAAARLPCLMLTIAPEALTLDQTKTLCTAGVILHLGHSDCDADTARRYMEAGASGVTHLFNAMSQLQSRAPGLVGATLTGDHYAGIIADGIHVDPANLRLGQQMLGDRLFIVSDAMAVAGSLADSFERNGRTITRRNGRLTLPDGTLAGADLTPTRAIQVMINQACATLEQALRMAVTTPARMIARPDLATLNAPLIRISHDLTAAAPI